MSQCQDWCSECEGYAYYDYQCPSESQFVRTVPSDDVDNSKVSDDAHIPPETVSQCSKWRPQGYIGPKNLSEMGIYRGYFQKSDIKIGL